MRERSCERTSREETRSIDRSIVALSSLSPRRRRRRRRRRGRGRAAVDRAEIALEDPPAGGLGLSYPLSIGSIEATSRVAPPVDEHDTEAFRHIYDGFQFVDDLTGASLDKSGVIKVRATEMAFFKKLRVYTKSNAGQT